jgi:hypothetical protein
VAAKSILKRGFKAKAERLALEYREKLGLSPHSPLCAFLLADYLSIPVYEATEFLVSNTDRDRLAGAGINDCGWSALTMKAGSGQTIILHNPFHTPARQQSNIMHELAHIICGHAFDILEIDVPIPIGMRNFNEVHEEEAKSLGSSLQLPRPGLLWGLKENMSVEQIAVYFNASVEMVNYRIRMSGAGRQHSYYN